MGFQVLGPEEGHPLWTWWAGITMPALWGPVRPGQRAWEIKGLGTESPRKDRLLQALLLSGGLKGAALAGSRAGG